MDIENNPDVKGGQEAPAAEPESAETHTPMSSNQGLGSYPDVAPMPELPKKKRKPGGRPFVKGYDPRRKIYPQQKAIKHARAALALKNAILEEIAKNGKATQIARALVEGAAKGHVRKLDILLDRVLGKEPLPLEVIGGVTIKVITAIPRPPSIEQVESDQMIQTQVLAPEIEEEGSDES